METGAEANVSSAQPLELRMANLARPFLHAWSRAPSLSQSMSGGETVHPGHVQKPSIRVQSAAHSDGAQETGLAAEMQASFSKRDVGHVHHHKGLTSLRLLRTRQTVHCVHYTAVHALITLMLTGWRAARRVGRSERRGRLKYPHVKAEPRVWGVGQGRDGRLQKAVRVEPQAGVVGITNGGRISQSLIPVGDKGDVVTSVIDIKKRRIACKRFAGGCTAPPTATGVGTAGEREATCVCKLQHGMRLMRHYGPKAKKLTMQRSP